MEEEESSQKEREMSFDSVMTDDLWIAVFNFVPYRYWAAIFQTSKRFHRLLKSISQKFFEVIEAKIKLRQRNLKKKEKLYLGVIGREDLVMPATRTFVPFQKWFHTQKYACSVFKTKQFKLTCPAMFTVDAFLVVIEIAKHKIMPQYFVPEGWIYEQLLMMQGFGINQIIFVLCGSSQSEFDAVCKILKTMLSAPKFKGCGKVSFTAILSEKHGQYTSDSFLLSWEEKKSFILTPEWFKGPNLFESIDSLEKVRRSHFYPIPDLRLLVVDKGEYWAQSIVGKILYGSWPNSTEIKHLYVWVNQSKEPVPYAWIVPQKKKTEKLAGDFIDFELEGISKRRIHAGTVVTLNYSLCLTTHIRARLEVLRLVLLNPIKVGWVGLIHINGSSVSARVEHIEWKSALANPDAGIVTIGLWKPLFVETFATHHVFGRFVLTISNCVVAFGTVLERGVSQCQSPVWHSTGSAKLKQHLQTSTDQR